MLHKLSKISPARNRLSGRHIRLMIIIKEVRIR